MILLRHLFAELRRWRDFGRMLRLEDECRRVQEARIPLTDEQWRRR